MATLKWPDGLRPAVKSGKQRTHSASYEASDPASAPLYLKNISTDQPTTWSVNFVLGKYDAELFWRWYTDTIEGGRRHFLMPIDTEFGLTEQEVLFDPETAITVTEEAEIFKYSAKLICRKLAIPAVSLALKSPDIYNDRAAALEAINASI
ncbi:hypothetical protein [Salmonella enterica]|uniref:hypothetical protein n=1 Tax=Salmonella enterica TaxID=28901 RepID=UPI001DCDFF3F|nr:hypothetical protein [Salmonella enterica]HCL5283991.1 hypothetical protein [Salmonella enterica]